MMIRGPPSVVRLHAHPRPAVRPGGLARALVTEDDDSPLATEVLVERVGAVRASGWTPRAANRSDEKSESRQLLGSPLTIAADRRARPA